MSEIFQFEQLDFGGIPYIDSSSKGFEGWKEGKIATQPQLYDTVCSDFGDQDNTAEEGSHLSENQRKQQEQIAGLANINSENSELIELQKEKEYTIPSASLWILKKYFSRATRSPSYDTSCTRVSVQKLSTNAIVRLAGEEFIHFCSQRVDDLSVLSHPFASSFFGLSDKDTKDVELVKYLLASAERVGQQQFARATKFLDQCDELSSNRGNPVQRLVYYFSEALREKIGRETGRITYKGFRNKQSIDVKEALMSPSPTVIAFHQEVPFSQVSQFAGMQAVVDNVARAKKVHIIDLEIRNGTQCTVLMQALAARSEYSLQHLKITAIGAKSKSKIEETGKRLTAFAHSMSLPFSFNVVMVADMIDLHEDLFELDAEEAVAVYSSYFLWTMIARPGRLECLMRVIRNINPCIMVVTEVEANHNSPVFVNRFTEALFFYGAFFDSLEDCMDHEDPNRMISESYLGQGIRAIVATEGEERTTRHVNINVWRAFFARFQMVEIELSTSSLYQASLVVNKFVSWSSCTLDMNGRCLFIGWKGTPVHSLSAWKFL